MIAVARRPKGSRFAPVKEGRVCEEFKPQTNTRCGGKLRTITAFNGEILTVSKACKRCSDQIRQRAQTSRSNRDDQRYISIAKEIFPNPRNYLTTSSYFEFDTDIGSFRYSDWVWRRASNIRIQMQADFDEYKDCTSSSDDSYIANRNIPSLGEFRGKSCMTCGRYLGLNAPFWNRCNCDDDT